MKKLLALIMAGTLSLSLLSACGNGGTTESRTSGTADAADTEVTTDAAEESASGVTYPVEIENELGVTVIEDEPMAIAIFDVGMLDILDTLGFGDRVVAVTHGQSFPDYLADYEGDMYVNLGGFKDWDEDALIESNPDLIFAGFRQNKSIDTVTAIASTIYFAQASDDTSVLDMLEQRVGAITALFGGEEEAEEYLNDIREKVAQITAYTDENEVTFVLVTAENGGISLGGGGSASAFLENDLGLVSLYEDTDMDGQGKGGGIDSASEEADADSELADGEVRGGGQDGESLDSLDGESAEGQDASDELRGELEEDNSEQTAEAVAYILENTPVYVFVLDKDAAEAEEGQLSAQEIVEATELADSDVTVVYLDDTIWSSASGGLRATSLQLDMLMELLGLS